MTFFKKCIVLKHAGKQLETLMCWKMRGLRASSSEVRRFLRRVTQTFVPLITFISYTSPTGFCEGRPWGWYCCVMRWCDVGSKEESPSEYFWSDPDRTYAAGGETVNYVALQWDYSGSYHSYVLSLPYKLFMEPSLSWLSGTALSYVRSRINWSSILVSVVIKILIFQT